MRNLGCKLRRMSKLISHEHVKWSRKLPVVATTAPMISHDYAKMKVFVRNDPNSREMVILLLNSRLLN